VYVYVHLFTTRAEKKNKIKAEERTQRQTDNLLHKPSLYYNPEN